MVEIAVALITLAGVIITVVSGNKKTEKSIKANADLTIYRIDQLEKKVEKHNQVVERVYILERKDAVEEEEIKVINHRISDLEQFHK
jgi:hypothetical protein